MKCAICKTKDSLIIKAKSVFKLIKTNINRFMNWLEK